MQIRRLEMEQTSKCAGMGEYVCECTILERCDMENCVFYKSIERNNVEKQNTLDRLFTLPKEKIQAIVLKYPVLRSELKSYLFGTGVGIDG